MNINNKNYLYNIKIININNEIYLLYIKKINEYK